MSSSVLKKLGFVAGVLLLLLLVYLYRQVPRHQAPFAKATDRAELVVLEQGSKKVELRKQGGLWKVGTGAPSNFPADEDKIKTLLSGLKDVQIEDEISDRADRATEYEVDSASGTQVRLLDAKNTMLAEGIFGKQAPDFAHLYFRYPDKPNVYLARGMIRGELGNAEVNSWRAKQLIDIPEAKIQGILVETKDFKTDFVRVSTDAWTLNGKPIDQGAVNSLIGALAHLRLDDFIDPVEVPALSAKGLTYARVNVKGENVAQELHIGAPDPKTKRYPVEISKDAVFAWLNEPSVKAILHKPSDFILPNK